MLAVISYPPIPIYQVGPFRLSLHGLAAAIGFAVGAWLLLRLAARRGMETKPLESVLTWSVVGALLGAPLLTVPARLFQPGFGFHDLMGSMSIIGGMVGGILAAWIRMRMLGIPFLPVADLAAPGLALGTVIGRLGDVAIVEHLGRPTSFVLGYGVRPGYDLAPQHDRLECAVGPAGGGFCGVYHPSAIYDLLGALVLFGVLLWLLRAWAHRRTGQLFSLWIAWYGLQRFLVDFTRAGGDNVDQMLGGLTWTQVSAGVLGLAGVAVLVLLGTRRIGERVPVGVVSSPGSFVRTARGAEEAQDG